MVIPENETDFSIPRSWQISSIESFKRLSIFFGEDHMGSVVSCPSLATVNVPQISLIAHLEFPHTYIYMYVYTHTRGVYTRGRKLPLAAGNA